MEQQDVTEETDDENTSLTDDSGFLPSSPSDTTGNTSTPTDTSSTTSNSSSDTNSDCPIWYRDADGDLFGDPNSSKHSCILPIGYVANKIDTNDTVYCPSNILDTCNVCDGDGSSCIDCLGVANGTAEVDICGVCGGTGQTTYYNDQDSDTLGDPNDSTLSCSPFTGYVTNQDDNCPLDPTSNVIQTWYADTDNDNAGDPNSVTEACSKPSGHVSNNTDGCPGNASLQSAITYYQDTDGDTYGDANSALDSCQSSPPTGYVSIGTFDECPTNANLHVKATYYADTDGDTFGDPNSSQDDCSVPSGYVTNSTDQCPNNANLQTPGNNWYPDTDGDTVGDAGSTPVASCADASTGAQTTISGIVHYLTNNDQCPSNSSLQAASTWYRDSDGDSLGEANDTQSSCTQPSGYVSNNNDKFIEHNLPTTIHGANSVYAIDLDGDGYNDVLSASSIDNTIAWYKNNGSGTFSVKQTITTSANGAKSVYAIDLDGDGDIDVLSASFEDDTIA